MSWEHFGVRQAYEVKGETRQEKSSRIRAGEALLKRHGYNPEFISRFKTGDEPGKARARAQAEEFVRLATAKTGLQLTIYQGMFL